MALLTVSGLYKSYPGLPVLHDVDLSVEEGEIVCLLGPSGGGKTTLLNIIAGLETPDAGRVIFAGQDLAGVPVHERHFGLMFQDFALFPHKNVAENVAFGLRMQGRPATEIGLRVQEALALVELAGYERRRVTELSGGEQQRVALARSLAAEPRLLMLDEPLGSLDRTLRENLMNELRLILKRVGLTALYVTHDQEEAFAVADRVFIMRARLDRGEGGRIEQAGTPLEVYRQPANPFVARFLGFRNLLPGRVIEQSKGDGGQSLYRVESSLGRLVAGSATSLFQPGDPVTLLIRPEGADPRPAGEEGDNIIRGRLTHLSFRGGFLRIQSVHHDDVELTFDVDALDADVPSPGEPVTLWLSPQAITLVTRDEGGTRGEGGGASKRAKTRQ